MRILILGAYGFIGSEISRSVVKAGHDVTGLGRDIGYGRRILPDIDWIKADLKNFSSAADWAEIVSGFEVVINASGILQSGPSDDVGQTQNTAIRSCADACVSAKVHQLIQISAVGSTENAQSDFMQSKASADQYVLATDMNSVVLRPGLVIGRNSYGGSEFLRGTASLPWVTPKLFPDTTIQCVAMSDLVDAVSISIADPENFRGSYDLVEEQGQNLASIIDAHRNWLGAPKSKIQIAVPIFIVALLSRCADMLSWLGWRSPLRSNAISALRGGVNGDAASTKTLLGRAPLSLDEALLQYPAGKQDRLHAGLTFISPILLLSLFLMWTGSGIIGFLEASKAATLLTNAGMTETAARTAVYSGSVIDIVLGLALLIRPFARFSILGMIAMTGSYLIGASIITPHLWLDPLAPLLKTLPAVGLCLACLGLTDKR